MASTATLDKSKYFATIEDPFEMADAMCVKITEGRKWMESKGLFSTWENKLSNYYGISRTGNTSQNVTPGGSEGELSLIKVNDLHQLLQEQLVLVTSQRPAGMAKAVNSDSTSLKSARIGTALAEYYLANVGLETKFISAVEMALLCDEGYVESLWDKDLGDPITADETGNPVMSGDWTIRLHAPWNSVRDFGASVDQQKWVIFSYKGNRFDFAAKFPKFGEEITNSEKDDLPEVIMNKIPDGSDMIFAHLLIHDRTAAVPNGRYTLMIANRVVLDTELPYKDYPVDRITPSDVIDGPTGYSASNDIMALEQVTDALHSQVTTNIVTFGGQSIAYPEGVAMNISDLGKGLRGFGLPPELVEKIIPLQLTKNSPDSFNYINKLEQKKQQQTGSTSGVLQEQAAQGSSGSAMALIDSKSIQFNSGIQRSYFRLLSSVMTKGIGILRSYADTPRVARIVGKIKAQGLKEFKYTGNDLQAISSIVYEMVNPISQTQGGRLQMAQDLIGANLIKSPKQYINVVTTGSLDTLTQDDESDQLLLIEENEALSEGKEVRVVLTEMHPDHIKSHMSVLSSVKAKEDPQLATATLQHIQEHISVWTQATLNFPGLLAALNIPPIPMPQMAPPGGPMGPPPGPGGPPAPQGPGPGPAAHKGPVGPPHPSDNPQDQAGQPRLPFNPETHERAEVPGVTA